MQEVKNGALLIADPFLQDANFMRSVVLVCDHQSEGSFGFVLNRLSNLTVGKLLEQLEDCSFPVFYGGPLEQNTVYFLHTCPDLIEGSIEILNGIFWGGAFEQVTHLIHTNQIKTDQIRFYLGYSGWAAGQLEHEINSKSWITSAATQELIFRKNTSAMWENALKSLGGEYELMVNYPIDPQLN